MPELRSYTVEDIIKQDVEKVLKRIINDFGVSFTDICIKYNLNSKDRDVKQALLRLIGYDMVDFYEEWRDNG